MLASEINFLSSQNNLTWEDYGCWYINAFNCYSSLYLYWVSHECFDIDHHHKHYISKMVIRIMRMLFKYYKPYSLQICNFKTIHRLLRYCKAHIIQVTILYTNLVVSYVGIGTLSYNMTCIFLYKKEWFYYM